MATLTAYDLRRYVDRLDDARVHDGDPLTVAGAPLTAHDIAAGRLPDCVGMPPA